MRIEAHIGETPTQFEVPDGSTPADIEDVVHHYMQNQSPIIGAAKDIWSDTKEAANNAINSTVQAVSEPLNNPNANGMMAIPDAAVRTVGKLGNLIGGAASLAFSPVQGALTASVANSGIIPATASAIKNNLVPNDTRFTADISPEAQHQVAQGIGGDLATTVGLGLAANQGTKMANAPTPLTVDHLNAASPNAYKAVEDNNGAVLNTPLTDKITGEIESAKYKPTTWGLSSEEQAVNKALSEFDGAQGKQMPLSDFQRMDSQLGLKKVSAWVSGDTNAGRIYAGLQSKIRNMVQPDTLNPGDITGSPEGINILTNDAIPLYAVKSKLQDITDMMEAANRSPNPSTAIRTGFSNLMKSGDFNSYPPSVQALISKAATTGVADDVLGILGSRLNAIAGQAVGGVPGAVASNITSMGFRGIRNSLKNNQADAIVSQMLESVRPSIEKFANYTSPSTPAVSGQSPVTIQGGLTTYINPNAKPLGKFTPNDIWNMSVAEAKKVPMRGDASTYFNPNAKPPKP